MNGLFKYYINMVMLKATPQDCPASQGLQITLIVLFLVLSVVNALTVYNLWGSVFTSVLDLGVLFLFTHVLLSNKKERIHQTLNAFLGAGIVIGIVRVLCSYAFDINPEAKPISDAGWISLTLILIWIVAVYGHIIRHAVDTSLSVGIAICFGYVIVNTIVLVTFAKVLGIS